jgi:hypothetical protein
MTHPTCSRPDCTETAYTVDPGAELCRTHLIEETTTVPYEINDNGALTSTPDVTDDERPPVDDKPKRRKAGADDKGD